MNKLAHLRDKVTHHAGKVAVVVGGMAMSASAFAQTSDIQTQILAEVTSNKAIAVAVCTAFIIAILSIRSLKLAKRGG